MPPTKTDAAKSCATTSVQSNQIHKGRARIKSKIQSLIARSLSPVQEEKRSESTINISKDKQDSSTVYTVIPQVSQPTTYTISSQQSDFEMIDESELPVLSEEAEESVIVRNKHNKIAYQVDEETQVEAMCIDDNEDHRLIRGQSAEEELSTPERPSGPSLEEQLSTSLDMVSSSKEQGSININAPLKGKNEAESTTVDNMKKLNRPEQLETTLGERPTVSPYEEVIESMDTMCTMSRVEDAATRTANDTWTEVNEPQQSNPPSEERLVSTRYNNENNSTIRTDTDLICETQLTGQNIPAPSKINSGSNKEQPSTPERPSGPSLEERSSQQNTILVLTNPISP